MDSIDRDSERAEKNGSDLWECLSYSQFISELAPQCGIFRFVQHPMRGWIANRKNERRTRGLILHTHTKLNGRADNVARLMSWRRQPTIDNDSAPNSSSCLTFFVVLAFFSVTTVVSCPFIFGQSIQTDMIFRWKTHTHTRTEWKKML